MNVPIKLISSFCLLVVMSIPVTYASGNDTLALFAKGETLFRSGKYQEALTVFDEVLKINSKLAPAWIGKGMAIGSLGKHQEALIAFDKALTINPNLAPAWYGKGMSLGHLGKYQEALIALDRALTINSNFALAWTVKGALLVKLGKNQEAHAAFDKAEEIEPKLADAIERVRPPKPKEYGTYCDVFGIVSMSCFLSQPQERGSSCRCYDPVLGFSSTGEVTF
jgi:tetratricopeptide (TPR) repeat protein